MTKKQKKSILVGTLLGDSCIWKHPNATNYNLQFTHSHKQIEYAKYKAKVINLMLFDDPQVNLWKQRNMGYSKILAWMFRTRVHPLLKSVRKLLYHNNKKTITRKALDILTPLGIAFWFMDDGWKEVKYTSTGAIKQRSMGLSTCEFSENEQDIIIDYFKEVWNVNLNKYFRKRSNTWILKCGVIEGLKFQGIIAKYVPECMKYKLFEELK